MVKNINNDDSNNKNMCTIFINSFRRLETTQMTWAIFVISALLKLMQKDLEFKDILELKR